MLTLELTLVQVPNNLATFDFPAASLARQSERPEEFECAVMQLEKILAGVLRVLTPLGPRYIRLSVKQRIYLLWIFRHFEVLPLQVLTPAQRRFMDALCAEPRFVSLAEASGVDAPVLGTLERRHLLTEDVAEPRTSGLISEAVSRLAPASYNPQHRS
jgi:hypothetical protein